MLSYNRNYRTRYPSCQYIFTACDSTGNSGSDSDDTSGTGQLEYQGETTSLTQLVFDKYGPEGSGAYNTDIVIFSDGINIDTGAGSGMIIDLWTYFSTSEVTAGTYNWTDADPPASNKFSALSAIVTNVNGKIVAEDLIAAGSFDIEVSGSTYTITGSVTTDEGKPANFIYTGPVTAVFTE
jgi:hypothetical protein